MTSVSRNLTDAVASRLAWLVAALAVAVAVFLATLPVQDSDLWYHLAYARQMLQSGTLVSDHSDFSFTPTSTAIIYCAWVAQLVFYGLYEWAGLPALFAFRYVVLIGIVLSWVTLAWRRQVFTHPGTWVLLVAGIWTMGDAAALKPQLWSVALLAATVAVYGEWRDSPETRRRWLAAWPLLTLLWVNAHGGVVMGLLLQGTVLAGEWLNLRTSGASRLSSSAFRALALAVTLSGAAMFCTPYLWHYPLQFFSVTLPAEHLAAVRDYDSIFAADQRPLRHVERGGLLLATCLWLAWTGRRRSGLNWAYLLPALAFTAAYASLIRLTPFLAPVLIPFTLKALAQPDTVSGPHPAHRRLRLAVVAAVVLLSANELRLSAEAIPAGAWRGLGNGYVNPEEEAEYLAQHYPDADIGNDYNTGGYLIFARWPRSRVFIDARYFPYIDWFSDYLRLESGAATGALIGRHPTDVWVVHLGMPYLLRWFRESPEWQVEFVGRSAAVFVRRGRSRTAGRLQFSLGVSDMRDLQQALWLMTFALDIGRRDVAEAVVSGYATRHARASDAPSLSRAQTLLAGLEAHSRGDHRAAVDGLRVAAPHFGGIANKLLAESASAEAEALWRQSRWAEGFQYELQALRAVPESPYLRHNVAVMAWWVEARGLASPGYAWRQEMQSLLSQRASAPPDLAQGLAQCEQILAGLQSASPQVYVLK